jgi:hypothetical protein
MIGEKPTTDCIVFQGQRSEKGYGVIDRGNKHKGTRRVMRAHRAAWMEVHGAIPEGMCVLHRCDNPPCIRIDHLFLGTNADNVADKMAKGRHRNGKGGKK